MSEELAPGAVRGPQLDKGQWPTFFDYQKNAEGETLFSAKSGFRFVNRVPAAHLDRGAAQSIAANTETIVLWDVDLFDNWSAYGLHTGVYTVPLDGIYLLTASVQWAANTWAVGNALSLWIKNLTKNLYLAGNYQTVVNASSYAYGASVTICAPLYKNEKVCVSVKQTNAAARSLAGDATFNSFGISKIGDL